MSNPSSDMKSTTTSGTQLMNAGRAPTKSQVPTNGGINKPIQKPKILQNATHILPKPPKDNPNEVIDQKAEAAKNSSVNEVTTSLENLVFSSTKAKIQAKLELRNDVPVRQISPQIVCISTKQKIELQTHPSKRDERQSSPTETNRVTPERSPSRGNSVVQSELTIDGRQPVIVISAQEDGVETFASQMESVQALVDDPDPRLLDALENPRDRLFVLKIEQEVVNFILTTSCESLDTPPSNSYHRMLIHKIAEFYRLTHVASTESADCVKLYRGAAARIPTIRLSDLKTPNQTPSETLPSGPQQAVKIMRRALSGKGYSLEKSAGKGMSDPQSGDPSKPTTREEREAAYQLARARIFGDFKESPPETPSPTKTPNERSQPKATKEPDDNFQSRSQFFPVGHIFPAYETQRIRGPAIAPMPNPNVMPYGFNHMHNLNPHANTYVPGQSVQSPDRAYPLPAPHQQVPPQQMPAQFYPSHGYPPHLQQGSPLPPPQFYNRPFLPPAGPQPMNFPPSTSYPGFNPPSNFASGMNSQYPSTGTTYGPPPLNSFARTITGFNRPFDASNINSFPLQPPQPHHPGSMFGGMNNGWPVYDGNPAQSRPLDPGDGSHPGSRPGMQNLGNRN